MLKPAVTAVPPREGESPAPGPGAERGELHRLHASAREPRDWCICHRGPQVPRPPGWRRGRQARLGRNHARPLRTSTTRCAWPAASASRSACRSPVLVPSSSTREFRLADLLHDKGAWAVDFHRSDHEAYEAGSEQKVKGPRSWRSSTSPRTSPSAVIAPGSWRPPCGWSPRNIVVHALYLDARARGAASSSSAPSSSATQIPSSGHHRAVPVLACSPGTARGERPTSTTTGRLGILISASSCWR